MQCPSAALPEEAAGTEWASEMPAFLCGVNDERKKHILQGTFFIDEETTVHEKRYDEILSDGRQQNNMSEIDLRKCKNCQKISGGFRKYSVNEMYCRIISVVKTYKRKGMVVMENIQKVFEGTPVF